MNIIFFGTPDFVVPVLEALNKKHTVLAVVTASDKKVGRKLLLTPSPVKRFATEHNILTFTPEKISEITSQLSTLNSELFVVAAYGKIIPQALLDLPTYGAVNIHPSPLPKYRGPSPITQSLLNGDKKTAISFMQMDAQMDHGPLLKKVPYEIPSEATTESLTYAMFQKSAELLPGIIEEFCSGKIQPTEQNDKDAVYTHIITKQDGYIDLENPPSPEQLDRMIRAYYPWPTVWSIMRIKNKEVRIKLLPQENNNFCIQLEGGKPMSIKDFINGYPELEEKMQKLLS